MKVVTAKEMTRLENLAYQAGSSEETFMANAGKGIAEAIHKHVLRHGWRKNVLLLCGKGNNGGDAYVAGLHLLNMGYDVYAVQVVPINSCSKLCQSNYNQFVSAGGIILPYNEDTTIDFDHFSLIVDGLFGTGFSGVIKEPYISLIRQANDSSLPIFAVDIPSGLNGSTGEIGNDSIKAFTTLFLELPKTGFFLKSGWNVVGELELVSFGLPEAIIEKGYVDLMMSTAPEIRKLMPKIVRNRHKYQAGYVVGVAGSDEMPGAAILSAWATLRGGAGIVRLLYPEGMEIQLASAPFEIIKEPYAPNDETKILERFEKASALFIGPGMGRSGETRQLLKSILPRLNKPCVIDGDALTIIAEENIPLPPNALLTPHHGEMSRLLKRERPSEISEEFLRICQSYVDEHRVTIVLKGGPTFILQPQSVVHVSLRGDPGMATAGSGDVLTGLLSALLAQGLSLHNAALVGTYLHGLAGELAAKDQTSYCLVASDILNYLPEAIKSLTVFK